MKTVKIYGYGWVGKAMHTLFPDAIIHDPEQGYVSEETCDVAFVCVPTPLRDDGRLDISIVQDVVKNAQEELIVIRSTVMPGTSDYLSETFNKKIVFQPEYLGETTSHPLIEQGNRQFMILGGDKEVTQKVIELYQQAYNANISIRQVTALEAEVVKLSENRAIAFKVAQCQELYDACKEAGVDYYTIRDAVYGDDPRFNLWFTFVFPENRGFHSSKCLKKDVKAWASWAEQVGANADVTNLIVEKSREYSEHNNSK